jgi:hypothetical protein
MILGQVFVQRESPAGIQRTRLVSGYNDKNVNHTGGMSLALKESMVQVQANQGLQGTRLM